MYYQCIIRIRRGGPAWPPKSGQPHRVAPTFHATQVKTLKFDNLSNYVAENSYTVNKTALVDKGWSLVKEQAQSLLNKLQKVGISLGEYVKGKIFRGVLTGLNEAFVINAETRERLIKEDPKSAELIKPFLIGRDIKRYEPLARGRYLILIPKGWTREQIRHSCESRNPEKTGFRVKPGMTETSMWKWFNETYPAIASYLEGYAEKGKKRYDKGEYWWELRACDYYADFEKPKIIYPNICKKPEFTFDSNGLYTNQKCFIIPLSDKYLIGLLNSSIMFFLFRSLLPKLRGDFYEQLCFL